MSIFCYINRMRPISLQLLFPGLLLLPAVTAAQMVRVENIGNDPVKLQLCIERATTKGKVVPFSVDSRYLERLRLNFPDSTFIAIDGNSPQLIECAVNGGTGRYGQITSSPEGNLWHLIKPQQFDPGIYTSEGRTIAAHACNKAGTAKINRPDLDHNVDSIIKEINIDSPKYHPGIFVAGIKAERYDIAVEGASFYKSSSPDLTAFNYVCLFSPMLELKALQMK